jgi:hypothetical protein
VIASVLAAVIFLLAGIYSFRQQDVVNHELCENVVENREADRVQWLTLLKLTLPTLETDAEKERFTILIHGVLRPIPSLECVDNKPALRRQ